MKKSDLIREYAKNNNNIRTAWFALKLLGMDTSSIEDGGPGSGNWGHKGRPGHVGGSGKGGGKQYRGGRSDIAYVGSKKDWMNGLSGERQQEAQKFMKRMRIEYSQPGETEKSVEQNIMEDPHYGSNSTRKKLLDYMAEARGWGWHANRLTNENWDENDRKLADVLCNKYGLKTIGGADVPDDDDTSAWDDEDLACWQDLKSKALGGPVSGREAPDELQYASGLKERPAPKTSWAASVPLDDYGDIENAIKKMTGDYSVSVDDISDPQKLEELEKKAFTEGFGNYQRDRGLKLYLKAKAKALGLPNASWREEEYPEGMLDRLTPEEKDRVLKLGRGAALSAENIIEGLDYEDQTVRWQDFAIINKMLGGYDATEDVEKLVQKKKAEEEEQRRRAEEERKRIEEERKRAAEERERKEEEAKKAYAPHVENAKKALRNNGLHSKINDAKTTGEVEEIMRTQGLFSRNTTTSLAGMDVEMAKSTAIAYSEIFQKYPFLVGELHAPRIERLSGETYANCMMLGGEVTCNSVWYSDKGKFDKQYQHDVESGYHPIGTDSRSVAYHEVAHALDGWLSAKFKNGFIFGGAASTISHDLCLAIKKKMGFKGNIAKFRRMTSNYADKNYKEWFAETLAEALTSKTPREPAVRLMKHLEEMIKNNGLERGMNDSV